MITKFIWKDGIHLQSLGTSYLLSKNFIEFKNNYLSTNAHNHFCLNKSHDFDSDIDGLINLRKAYQNNPLY